MADVTEENALKPQLEKLQSEGNIQENGDGTDFCGLGKPAKQSQLEDKTLPGHNIKVSEVSVCPLNVAKFEADGVEGVENMELDESSREELPSMLSYLFYANEEESDEVYYQDALFTGDPVLLKLKEIKNFQIRHYRGIHKYTTHQLDKNESITLCRVIAPFGMVCTYQKSLNQYGWRFTPHERTVFWDMVFTALVKQHPYLDTINIRHVLPGYFYSLKQSLLKHKPRNRGWKQIYDAVHDCLSRRPSEAHMSALREKVTEHLKLTHPNLFIVKPPKVDRPKRRYSFEYHEEPLPTRSGACYQRVKSVIPLVESKLSGRIKLEPA
ncbi:unnamed protein product [Bursaphelenchus okinawaensis]|uniref:Uncharacterized protein n=1 Tax=Bursaphelenchus okinawaensis TaxID=465554 RepID=A0A811KIQ0_9BILA|nr:unnamed protein product [Bursaphelenchus okinawaensis]CAG9105424.1 unnamed protein product [Bursaphelenchus okinawaensis]